MIRMEKTRLKWNVIIVICWVLLGVIMGLAIYKSRGMIEADKDQAYQDGYNKAFEDFRYELVKQFNTHGYVVIGLPIMINESIVNKDFKMQIMG